MLHDLTHDFALPTGVGAVVGFTNLSSTNKFLGHSAMPIINSNRPLVVLNDNFELPEKPIAPNGTDMTGCILSNARVVPKTIEAFQTGCDGPMCDQNNLLANDVLVGRCACMQMDKSEKS